MLRKLYKHELHALGRFLVPAWLIILAFTACSRLIWMIKIDNFFFDIMKTWMVVLSIVGIIVIYIITLAMTVSRFFKHMLTKEGYLTFTLPFTAAQHIFCKLICAIMSFLAATFVAFLGINILCVGTGFGADFYYEIVSALTALFNTLRSNPHYIVWIIISVVDVFLFAAATLLQLYACMGLGSRIMKNKIVGSVVAYLIFYFAQQILGTLLIFIFGLYFGNGLLFLNSLSGDSVAFFVITFVGIVELIYCVIFYFITWNSLEKHLNLE